MADQFGEPSQYPISNPKWFWAWIGVGFACPVSLIAVGIGFIARGKYVPEPDPLQELAMTWIPVVCMLPVAHGFIGLVLPWRHRWQALLLSNGLFPLTLCSGLFASLAVVGFD